MKIKTSDEVQGPNLMVSRHGASANELQKCLQCRHLSSEGNYTWYCDQLLTVSGHTFPWDSGNRACGKFEERENEMAVGH